MMKQYKLYDLNIITSTLVILFEKKKFIKP